jgi:leucyl-tRNA synthetase/very-short-patch-repair endonuclease
MEYDFRQIEQKWQQNWREKKTYKVTEDTTKPKFYALDMFPYPSGAGLHVGHPLGYIASDIIARYKRHLGYNVLHPMGYDSFGLPAEQYAIQTGQHPEITTKTNIARYREQLDQIGFAYDWDREVRTSDPSYYKWTQWIFALIYNSWFNKENNKAEHIDTLIKKFEENGNQNVNAACEDDWFTKLPLDKFFFGKDWQGDFTATDWKSMNEEQQQMLLMQFRMAYLADSVVNWCPALGTVLANDEIKDGKSERGGHAVEQKLMRQWSMRIGAYSERLLQGLNNIDWPENIKEVQRNWIGKSEGAHIEFQIQDSKFQIGVFTTRPDTIFGVSFMTLAPEHELVLQITTPEYRMAVEQYIANAKLKTERDRQADVKNVSGQFTGAYALHPFTNEKIPIWIGEYVLAGYGTGAVMAVPAGDQRDWDFAKKFDLPIPNIFEGIDISEKAENSKEAILCNSDFLNGLSYKAATKKVIAELETRGIGKGKINYRMRDAVFSRQRYWGEPFPVYYTIGASKNEIPYLVNEKDLPIVLPEVDKYLPTESGEPSLARAKNWSYTPHPLPLSEGEGSAQLRDVTANENWGKWQMANSELWGRLKNYAREMRKNPTDTEDLLWQELRNNKLGHKIRRQYAIKEFIVDLVCLNKRLVIEIDGNHHYEKEQKDYDDVRSTCLNFFGFKVLRFTNDEVLKNINDVLNKIKIELDKRPSINDETNTQSDSIESGVVVAPLSTGGPDLHQEGVRFEFNTMPGWAGSSWYFLRYMDAHNNNEFASREKIDYWNQVDLYMGGAEHATGHLLYSRFWTKILFDHGYIGFDEPFKKMINQGMILGRSSFVYRYCYNSAVDPLRETIVQPTNLYISSEINKWLFENEDLWPEDLIEIVKSQLSEREFAEIGGWRSNVLIQKLHVDISLVNNDELDEVRFKSLSGNENALLIRNKEGKYICGWEIEKMSKSKYNVQTPDELVEKFGADTLRMYEMFLGPVEQSKPWDTKGINGVHNFLRKLWRLSHDKDNNFAVSNDAPTAEELKTLHTAIKKVTEDLNRYSWNTVVSTLMICVNELTEQKCNKRQILEPLCILLSPYAPHIAEELWEKLGEAKSALSTREELDVRPTSITDALWPQFNEAYLTTSSFDYPVSFNGKTRFFLPLGVELSQDEVIKAVLADEQTSKYLEGKEPKKIIVVPKRIVNVVV